MAEEAKAEVVMEAARVAAEMVEVVMVVATAEAARVVVEGEAATAEAAMVAAGMEAVTAAAVTAAATAERRSPRPRSSGRRVQLPNRRTCSPECCHPLPPRASREWWKQACTCTASRRMDMDRRIGGLCNRLACWLSSSD